MPTTYVITQATHTYFFLRFPLLLWRANHLSLSQLGFSSSLLRGAELGDFLSRKRDCSVNNMGVWLRCGAPACLGLTAMVSCDGVEVQ
ncbi:hypothetical protein M0R45_023652 [Rubus argutus]|uniref:Uncharacterized protein n=1 Tax=Rubus argutus TaxID=59490 RepID=A0AAW1WNB8_RUBAR